MDAQVSWGATQRARNTADHYRSDIDDLRAVAVIVVAAFRAFPHSIRGGFIGVDVFYPTTALSAANVGL